MLRKSIHCLAGLLFLLWLPEAAAQVLHVDQSILLSPLPKAHSPKRQISPQVLKHYRPSSKRFEQTFYIDIQPLFRDTLGEKVYYFVAVFPETREKKPHVTGFIEQSEITETLSHRLDSCLAGNASCLVILRTKERWRGHVRPVQDQKVYCYSVCDYYSVCLLNPGPFVLTPSGQSLEAPVNKLFLLDYDHRFLRKRIPYFGPADAYFKTAGKEPPLEEKYTAAQWTGSFTEGLANEEGLWCERVAAGKRFGYTNWNIYKGHMQDNRFHGVGRYYHSTGVQQGNWHYSDFVGGSSWYPEVNIDTSAYFLRHQYIYGGYLLSTEFAPDCERWHCKIRNPAYEAFVTRDSLFPKEELMHNRTFRKSDLHAKSQSNALIRMAFLLYSRSYTSSYSRFLRPTSFSEHSERIFFIVCKNNKGILLTADLDDHSYSYYDLNGSPLAGSEYRNGFIKGLKQACGCN